jgi:hypothetical protein
MKLRVGARVTLNLTQLSPGNREWWRGHGGDGEGTVTSLTGNRAHVEFDGHGHGVFDVVALVVVDTGVQGGLWA